MSDKLTPAQILNALESGSTVRIKWPNKAGTHWTLYWQDNHIYGEDYPLNVEGTYQDNAVPMEWDMSDMDHDNPHFVEQLFRAIREGAEIEIGRPARWFDTTD